MGFAPRLPNNKLEQPVQVWLCQRYCSCLSLLRAVGSRKTNQLSRAPTKLFLPEFSIYPSVLACHSHSFLPCWEERVWPVLPLWEPMCAGLRCPRARVEGLVRGMEASPCAQSCLLRRGGLTATKDHFVLAGARQPCTGMLLTQCPGTFPGPETFPFAAS